MKVFNTLQNQIILLIITLNFINSLFITSPNQFSSWNLSSPLKVDWISSINDPKRFYIEVVNSKFDSSSIQTSLTKTYINSNQESFNLYGTTNLKPSKDYQLHFISSTGETFAKSPTFEILPSITPTPNLETLNPKTPYTHQTNQSQPLEPKQQMVWQVLVSVSVSVGIGISLVSTVGGYTTMSYPGLLSEV
ncbi:uncharacterized protein MELLADRAFT_72449 [Melampsora larici-populina 98AG31]|uniref:Yeast cell wall synthesis Kre9/Knh1-like N-terminal domain-containing protein n=1 Tax=Melampsora larici-populina (strain 98AG31 / pathotype 3-4-7) TaxID=747676 RepID=F4RU67_MELLP|nr:uncharacterized protein MELLADRAFT_72449 [Melampsora larici-populina 98AG31]EGG04138.1 hypothetical protein MELLADRAFT_72449 [Melampsora larici-populina 98AG31]